MNTWLWWPQRLSSRSPTSTDGDEFASVSNLVDLIDFSAVQVVSCHQQLKTQLARNLQVRNTSLFAHLLIVVEILDNFF